MGKKYCCDGNEQCHNRCTFEAMGSDEPDGCLVGDYIENWIEEKVLNDVLETGVVSELNDSWIITKLKKYREEGKPIYIEFDINELDEEIYRIFLKEG
jgi:hypothetical protein